MNTSCCVCLDETLCVWNCGVCCEGHMCGSCRCTIEVTEGLAYDEPIKCPICRTPNIKDAYMTELLADNFYGWREDDERLEKYPVLVTFMRNLEMVNNSS